jgi:hypothetical protein
VTEREGRAHRQGDLSMYEVQVGGADPAGPNLDDDVKWSGSRIGDVLERQRRAGGEEAGRSHASVLEIEPSTTSIGGV